MLSYFNELLRIDLHFYLGKPILVGVSGGPDSLCLLDLLNRAGFSVVVAHLDHGLRPESGDEARRVGVVAESFGSPFVLEETDVAVMAEEQGLSLEEAARIARYRFLFKQAQNFEAQAVAVGHNANDQVETVLMHLLRGTGLGGLKGMQPYSLPNSWSKEIPLVRPLLPAWRSDILDYCQKCGLDPIFDSSNMDTNFFRNRMRHELIPILEEFIPGVQGRLWRMTDILGEEDAVLEGVVSAARNICLNSQGTGFVSFSTQVLGYQPLAIQRRLIRWAVSTLRPNVRDLDFAAVERALELLVPLNDLKPQSSSKQVDMALGIRAFLEDELLYVAAWETDLPSVQWPQLETNAADADEVVFQIPGEVRLSNGWRLRGNSVNDLQSAREQAHENDNPYQAWLDLGEAGKAGSTLNVRVRQPGDRFKPLGMGGKSIKLTDFMINQKIPRRARDGWPLVCAGEEIVWMPGYRQAHDFRLSKETQRVIFLQLFPPN